MNVYHSFLSFSKKIFCAQFWHLDEALWKQELREAGAGDVVGDIYGVGQLRDIYGVSKFRESVSDVYGTSEFRSTPDVHHYGLEIVLPQVNLPRGLFNGPILNIISLITELLLEKLSL